METNTLAVGCPVQHRAWYWIGKIIEVPEGDITNFSSFKIELPTGDVQVHALFSLISDEDEFVYDWSEFDEAPSGRSKSKNKKSKHKG